MSMRDLVSELRQLQQSVLLRIGSLSLLLVVAWFAFPAGGPGLILVYSYHVCKTLLQGLDVATQIERLVALAN